MEFDFAKVVEASKDNPVYYVQYAHARIQRSMRKAADEHGITPDASDLARLGEDEIDLVRRAAQFPREVEAAARAREPHRIAFYLYDLASDLHAFYTAGNKDTQKRFILEHDKGLSGARLFLADAIGQVLRNGLRVLGVQAVDSM